MIKQFLTSKKGMTFLALFITLLLGITIGTIISDDVSSAQEEHPVQLLQIQGEGSPLLLDGPASLAEGFARVANTVEPAVVNISTTAVIRTSGRQGGGSRAGKDRSQRLVYRNHSEHFHTTRVLTIETPPT